MQILAHRGLWHTPSEKNTRQALNRAFEAGFGTETDVRDLDGELVVSHDMPRRGALPLAVMLEDYAQAGYPGWLALNIKSDGLTDTLQALLTDYAIPRYFCFDMSVPDTLHYLRAGLTTAARISEYEPEGRLSLLTSVLWVDAFEEMQISVPRLHALLEVGKQVCLVSPELHGRDSEPVLRQLAALPPLLRECPGLMLCTDRPMQAREVMA